MSAAPKSDIKDDPDSERIVRNRLATMLKIPRKFFVPTSRSFSGMIGGNSVEDMYANYLSRNAKLSMIEKISTPTVVKNFFDIRILEKIFDNGRGRHSRIGVDVKLYKRFSELVPFLIGTKGPEFLKADMFLVDPVIASIDESWPGSKKFKLELFIIEWKYNLYQNAVLRYQTGIEDLGNLSQTRDLRYVIRSYTTAGYNFARIMEAVKTFPPRLVAEVYAREKRDLGELGQETVDEVNVYLRKILTVTDVYQIKKTGLDLNPYDDLYKTVSDPLYDEDIQKLLITEEESTSKVYYQQQRMKSYEPVGRTEFIVLKKQLIVKPKIIENFPLIHDTVKKMRDVVVEDAIDIFNISKVSTKSPYLIMTLDEIKHLTKVSMKKLKVEQRVLFYSRIFSPRDDDKLLDFTKFGELGHIPKTSKSDRNMIKTMVWAKTTKPGSNKIGFQNIHYYLNDNKIKFDVLGSGGTDCIKEELTRMFPNLHMEFSSASESNYSGQFTIFGAELDRSILCDMIVNDKMFGEYFYINERSPNSIYKPSAKIHYNNTNGDIGRIQDETDEITDAYDEDYEDDEDDEECEGSDNCETSSVSGSVSTELETDRIAEFSTGSLDDERLWITLTEKELKNSRKSINSNIEFKAGTTVIDVKLSKGYSMEVINRFMNIFTHMMGVYVSQYSKYKREYAFLEPPVSRIKKGGVVIERPIKLLRHSEEFRRIREAISYSRKCGASKQVTLVPEDEVEWRRKQGTIVLPYRYHPDEPISFYYMSKNPSFPYPGLTKSGVEDFIAVPCCFKDPQENTERYKMLLARPEEYAAYLRSKPGKTKEYADSKRLIKESETGKLPPNIDLLLKVVDSDGSYTRHGTSRVNSFIHAVLMAIDYQFSKLSDRDKSIRCEEVRKSIDEYIHPELMSQELWDYDRDEILDIVKGKQTKISEGIDSVDSFSPRIFYRCLETLFKINIFVFNQDAFDIPRHSIVPIRPRPDPSLQVVIVLWNDELKTCDLIKRAGKSRSGDIPPIVGQKIYDFYGKYIVNYMIHNDDPNRTNLSINLCTVDMPHYFEKMFGLQSTHQIIDGAGKQRGLILKRDVFVFLVTFAPNAPSNLPPWDRESITTSFETVLDVFNINQPVAISKNVDRITGVWFPLAIDKQMIKFGIHVSVSVNDTYVGHSHLRVSVNDLPIGPSDPILTLVPDNAISITSTRRQINSFIKIIEWLYTVVIDSETPEQFLDGYFEFVDTETKFEESLLPYYLPAVPSIEDGIKWLMSKNVIEASEREGRVRFYLSLVVRERLTMHLRMFKRDNEGSEHTGCTLKELYTMPSDFEKSMEDRVFLSHDDMTRWILHLKDRKMPIGRRVYHNLNGDVPGSLDPYFYFDGYHMYIIQNVSIKKEKSDSGEWMARKNLALASYIGKIWMEQRRNVGPHVVVTDDMLASVNPNIFRVHEGSGYLIKTTHIFSGRPDVLLYSLGTKFIHTGKKILSDVNSDPMYAALLHID
jgi:hypothetical protein